MDLKQIIEKTLANKNNEPRNYIGASSIGNPCERAIWYGINNPESKEVYPKQKLTFEIGKRLETMILDLLKESKLDILTDVYVGSEYPLFEGHLDAYILENGQPKYILEIKTANDSSFNTFKNKGVKLWYPEYYDQVQSYMGMINIRKCILIAINKNTSELHQEIIPFDEYRYDYLLNKAKRIGETVNPPRKINESASFFRCKMCFYKKVCHGSNMI